MALNRWLGTLLIVSALGFAGCGQPTKKNPDSQPTAAATKTMAETPAPAETAAAETPAPAETAAPDATASPAAAETPTEAGSTAAAGSREAMEEDFENADGMAGYEDVLKMEVPPSSPDVVAKGKEVFAANCASCHGEAGMGDGAAGANLDPKPRNLTVGDEYKYGHLELAIYRTGAYGVEGTGMAPLGDVLEPEEMWAVTHYIRTLQK